MQMINATATAFNYYLNTENIYLCNSLSCLLLVHALYSWITIEKQTVKSLS